MTESVSYEILPGYGSQEELAVEEDHIVSGTFRSIIAILGILVVLVIVTVFLAVHEGQQARLANDGMWQGPTPGSMARTEAMKSLNRYEVIDAEAGTYRIPIERAMAAEVIDRGGSE